jgi:small GTP-binding protein
MPNREEIKIVFVGEQFVGKTSIITKYITEIFSEEYKSTIGGVFQAKRIKQGEKELILNIWDTAGQEFYRCLAPIFFRNAQIAIIVVDVTELKTFQEVSFWINELRSESDELSIIHICGNKSDLEEEREIGYDELRRFASENDLEYSETTARSGSGIDSMFETVLNQYINTHSLPTKQRTKVDLNKEVTSKSVCCKK